MKSQNYSQMIEIKNICFFIIACFVSTQTVQADNTSSSCKSISIADLVPSASDHKNEEDLLKIFDMPVSTATYQATCAKQAASIVTVISGEEILNMGARDLIDVLRLVPGFDFGVDVSNVVGLGIRGIQAHEGKVSVFIDGISITEHRFGTTAFGNHFPVDGIDRIEIIRGPGSIRHGNFAEMGVINIITKSAADINGVKISANYGHFQRGEARQNINLMAGKKWDDWEVSFSGKYGMAHRSDRIYTGSNNVSFDMVGENELDSRQGNLNIKYKDFSLRLLVDEYTVNSKDRFTAVQPNRSVTNKFNTYAADLNYSHNFTDNIKLEAQAYFSRQSSWERTAITNNISVLRERVYADYYKFNLKSTFATDNGDYLVFGGSFTQDEFTPHVTDINTSLPAFRNYTLYLEGLYKTDWVDVLAGLRFDSYNLYGANFAPRIALTKSFDKFHFKALYSHAFRIPTGGNYQLNEEYNQINSSGNRVTQVQPEKNRTAEIELGYNVFDNLDLTLNLFRIENKNIILYQVDSNNDDFYINGKALDTQGIEAGLHFKDKRIGYLDLNYSYYQSVRNTAEHYQIINSQGQIDKNRNIGFATHKVTANALAQISPNFSVNQTLIFLSDRYGYSGSQLVHYQPTWIYNLYFRYQNLLTKGLDVGLGIYDVFNQQHEYVQPYNGQHPALPAPSRELMLNMSYTF